MKNLTNNPKQPSNFAKALRCGAKTRSGNSCRSPAVTGRQRCRMHGGTNRGAPKGNSNARKHGNRSAEATAQLKLVRQTDRDLRLLGKVRDGIQLKAVDWDRLIQLYWENQHRDNPADSPSD